MKRLPVFIYTIIILLLDILAVTSKTIRINILAASRDMNYDLYSYFESEFNKYSKENNLNVTAKVYILTNSNSTTLSTNSYGSTVEALLKNKHTMKYDIFFYDNTYKSKYAPYLMDLHQYVSEEELKDYNSEVISKLCFHQDKLVGMPIKIGFNLLFSNTIYLNKYKKRAPKTWNELIETSEYIINMEKELNNTEIIAYEGVYDDSEECTCSINEMIYSFRQNSTYPFPGVTSHEAVMALETLKFIKDKFSLDAIYKIDLFSRFNYLNLENILFKKFWMFDSKKLYGDLFILSPLPGYKEGVSGSTVTGYNIGISEKIDNEKKEAAIEILKFITSKEFQKKALITNNNLASAIFSLYEDDEVCEKLDCELFRSLQLITKPIDVSDDYDKYDIKYRENIHRFLYGEKSAKEVLKEIEDLTKIYYLSLRTDDSKFGLIWFIFITVNISLITISLIFIIMEKFTFYFKFLPLDFWIILILGILLILSSCYSFMGPLSPFKCNLHTIMISVGLTMIYITILYKLIINFPENYKIIRKITKHRFLYLFSFLSIKLIQIIVFSYHPYEIETLIIPNGQNFQVCSMKNFVGQFLIIFDLSSKLVIILVIFVLVFAEWNIQSTFYDIRLIVITLYIDMIPIFLIVLVSVVKANNYLLLYVSTNVLIYLMAILKYICLYGSRILLRILNKNSKSNTFINKIALNYIENITVTSTQTTQNNNTFSSNNDNYNRETKNNYNNNNPINSKKIINENSNKSFFSKIIYYHYINNSVRDNDTTSYSLALKKTNNFI